MYDSNNEKPRGKEEANVVFIMADLKNEYAYTKMHYCARRKRNKESHQNQIIHPSLFLCSLVDKIIMNTKTFSNHIQCITLAHSNNSKSNAFSCASLCMSFSLARHCVGFSDECPPGAALGASKGNGTSPNFLCLRVTRGRVGKQNNCPSHSICIVQ